MRLGAGRGFGSGLGGLGKGYKDDVWRDLDHRDLRRMRRSCPP